MTERKPFDKAHGRDYTYDKQYESTPARKRYRAALNRYNRQHNDPKGNHTDASHKGGKIVGYESEKVNRGRAGEGGRIKGKHHKRRYF